MLYFNTNPKQIENRKEEQEDEKNQERTESPFIIRIIPGLNSDVERLIFSDDGTSQLMAIFVDGIVRVYNLNEVQAKEKIKSNNYVNKQHLKHTNVFQPAEMSSFDYNYILVEDENRNYLPKTNLVLTNA